MYIFRHSEFFSFMYARSDDHGGSSTNNLSVPLANHVEENNDGVNDDGIGV